ncbi:MAG: hypothetical protein ACOYI8_08190 [Christensenellales bacterium]|jgi:hypothetical protein
MQENQPQERQNIPRNRKEDLYEHFRGKISVRTLDIIIGVLVVLFILVVVLGTIKGNR